MRYLLDRILLLVSFSFHHFKYILPFLSGLQMFCSKISFSLMGISLYVICCFSLSTFNICSFCLIFVGLINICCVSLCVYPFWEALGFLDLGGYFLSYFREIFNYNLLKYFLMDFILSSSRNPMI